jgi:hypothetical protein
MDDLNGAEIQRKFEIQRAPTDGSRRSLLVLSNLLVICPTHWRGRTQPCTWPNCEDCDKGQVPEIHSYLIVAVAKTEEKLLWEFTAGPTAVLKEYQDRVGYVHGLGIEVGRRNDKPNGPQWVKIKNTDLKLGQFGMPPDVKEILQTMWRFDPEKKATADAMKFRRDNARGDETTPPAGELGSNAEKVSNHQKKRRKRS